MAINNPVITSADTLQGIAEEIQAKDGGGKMLDTEMRGRIAALQVGDPYEKLNEFLNGTIKYLKVNNCTLLPAGFFSNYSLYGKLVFCSLNSYSNTILAETFRAAFALKFINSGNTRRISNNTFRNCTALTTLIIVNSSQNLTELGTTDPFYNTPILSGTGYVWVYDSLKSGYQSATNWSVYASQIKGFSEAPVYDSATTYSIGDVCKYNGKFYGYCKEDLTSSTGNLPTGTTEDNQYWEYVADIEVI